ncbi:MAG: outer membrane lipoprotein carrier protein LolA [Phycisphaerales bacterium JB038]
MNAILLLLAGLNLLTLPAATPQPLSLAASLAALATAPPEAEGLPTADELLTRLEEADADLASLQADVMYRKTNSLVGEEERRSGKLYFRQEQAEGEAQPRRQFAIEFQKLYIDDRKEMEERTFIFDGRWLVEKLPSETPRQMFKREIVPPGETFDPLAIGEGPFPIPIGQKREEILKHYEAEVLPPGEGQLEQHSYHIRLQRKPEARDRLDVETLDLWYLREDLLPVHAQAIDDGGNITEVSLVRVERNIAIDDRHFDTTAPTEGWEVEITSGQER